MTLPGITANSQGEQLKNEMATQSREVTEQVRIPGVETLHERPVEEIGIVLANLIKSRSGITKLTYVKGSHFEITSDGNPFGQLR